MSEFWEFYAAKTDAAKAKAALKKLKVNAVLLEAEGWLYITCRQSSKVSALASPMIHFADHEGSAWSMKVFVDGKQRGGGTFGTNLETGARNQGFTGDLQATADILGVDAKKLQKTFQPKSSKFLALLGLTVMPFDPDDVPKGVHFIDELD